MFGAGFGKLPRVRNRGWNRYKNRRAKYLGDGAQCDLLNPILTYGNTSLFKNYPFPGSMPTVPGLIRLHVTKSSSCLHFC